MAEENDGDDETVTVTMELSGEYDDVVDRLRISEDSTAEIEAVAADFSRILETVDAIDGGTKSVIAENLPGDMTADYDGDAVVSVMQVLERYDLVTLDGNTWKVAT